MMRETQQWGQEQIAERAKRIVAFAELYWLSDSSSYSRFFVAL